MRRSCVGKIVLGASAVKQEREAVDARLLTESVPIATAAARGRCPPW